MKLNYQQNQTKSFKTYLILLVFLIFMAPLAKAQMSFNGTLSKVNVKVLKKHEVVTPGTQTQFAIVIDIKDGWHLNAHKPFQNYLIGVDINFTQSENAMVANIQYPAAKQAKFDFAQDVLKVYKGKAVILIEIKTSDELKPDTYILNGKLQMQACSNTACLPPSYVNVRLPFTIGNQNVLSDNGSVFEDLNNRETVVMNADAGQIASMFNEYGYFWAFLSIFLIGLALNLTPCVYPMMSVTVSLFGGKNNSQTSTASTFSKALVYVLGIVFMYSSLGVMAAYTGNIFGSWLQSPSVLAGIGILILLLSLSMFGVYELQPPAWLMQKIGKTQQVTGYVGHFLSGLMVGVFAAPCIGPPIIALLAFVGAQGSAVFGFFAFFVMALGLGIPYLILGTFSGLLNKMPQSGMWMIWVKKVFGVVLVGVALFYLSLAFAPDLSMTAVLATIVIGGIYLGFVEGSGNVKPLFRWFKYAVGVAALVVGFMLFQNLQKEGVEWQKYSASVLKQTTKPVILDFYADWCIPCIELERKTYTDSRVITLTKPFIRMKVDLTHFNSAQAEKLRKRYDIVGVPSIVFLNGKGNEIEKARIVGFITADELLERIENVKKKVNFN